MNITRIVCSVLVASIVMLIASCNRQNQNDLRESDKNILNESKLLEIIESSDGQFVIISNPSGDIVARYLLVDRGVETPENIPEGFQVLRIPMESIVIDSEVYGAAIDELCSAEKIKGVFDSRFITQKNLKKLISESKIVDVGQPDSPTLEKILELNPDAILVSYYDGMQMTGLSKTGVPIVKMFDLQESDPLGRAEWIRFIGRLIGKSTEADSIYTSVKNEYGKLKDQVSNRTNSHPAPRVMTETLYNGTWYVPGGKSYQAKMIEDAGGDYCWKETERSGSLNLTMEQVLEKASDSDIWLIKSFGEKLSAGRLLAKDRRYGEFKPLQTGKVYYSDTSESDLFIDFPFHPERLLKDYMIIFGNGTEEELKYFKKI